MADRTRDPDRPDDADAARRSDKRAQRKEFHSDGPTYPRRAKLSKGRVGRLVAGTLAILLIAGVIVTVSVGFVVTTAYADRLPPGSMLAGYDISGQSPDQVDPVITQAQDAISVDITVDGVTRTAPGSALGITVDKAAIEESLNAATGRFLWWFELTKSTTIPLSVSINQNQFNAWLVGNFPDSFTAPLNSSLAYDPATSQFDVTAAMPGSGASEADITHIADTLAAQSGKGSFTVSPSLVFAPFGEDLAGTARDWVNSRLKTACSFSFEGTTLYTLTPADIASMATITIDPDKGPEVSFTPDRIGGFIHTTLAAAVNTKPQTEQVLVDTRGNPVGVSPGTAGRELADTASLAQNVADALTNAKPVDLPVRFQDVPYDTQVTAPVVTAAPPSGFENRHWADVDLTTQTVTLMNGAIPGATFITSSGAPGYDTPTGTFHVYAKTYQQTLMGCPDGVCYEYPNVHYLTWFYRDYGFHEAYWNEQFGTPVSHGCLNLTIDNAQAVYEWLSIGDAVVIHD